MDESNEQGEVQQKRPKWLLIGISVAIILVAGFITVQALFVTSAKEDYFLAEKSAAEQLGDTFKSRFADELAWKEHVDENAIESTYEITAQMNDPSMAGMGMGQMISNSHITIESAIDKQEKVSSASISAGMAGMELSGLEAYIDNNDFYASLPFLDKILQVNGEDIGRILHEIDPETFDGEETIDFKNLFNQNVLEIDDIEYIQEEYVEYIYDELPEDAFETTSEEITIGEDSIDTDKISFVLSEEKTKSLIKDVLDKMSSDEKLKEMIFNQLAYAELTNMDTADNEIETFKETFESNLKDASARVDELTFTNGFNSVIWVDNGIIAKRDLSLTVEYQDEKTNLHVEGTNKKSDGDQVIDYAITTGEEGNEETLSMNADLSLQDGDANDIITFSTPEAGVTIEANQSEGEEGSKTFDRSLTVEEQGTKMIALHWQGEANYEADQMSVDHTFFADDGATINQDTLSIQINETGSTVDKVELPNSDEVKNLSDMTGDEIIEYFETEVSPKVQQWMSNMMGAGSL